MLPCGALFAETAQSYFCNFISSRTKSSRSQLTTYPSQERGMLQKSITFAVLMMTSRSLILEFSTKLRSQIWRCVFLSDSTLRSPRIDELNLLFVCQQIQEVLKSVYQQFLIFDLIFALFEQFQKFLSATAIESLARVREMSLWIRQPCKNSAHDSQITEHHHEKWKQALSLVKGRLTGLRKLWIDVHSMKYCWRYHASSAKSWLLKIIQLVHDWYRMTARLILMTDNVLNLELCARRISRNWSRRESIMKQRKLRLEGARIEA